MKVPVHIKDDVLQDLVNLFSACLLGHTLECTENFEMLSWSQKIKQDVVLGAHAHKSSYLIHLIKQVFVVNLGSTHGWWDQTGQHRNSSRLSCSVVSEESKNLSIVHPEVDSLDCMKVTKVLPQLADL